MSTIGIGLVISVVFSLVVATSPSLAQSLRHDSDEFSAGEPLPVQQVNIIAQRDANGVPQKVDPRWPLTVLGPKLGMSAEEIRTARKTTGYVVCPGAKFNNPQQGSAVIIGQGDYLLTSAHIFIDKESQRREPLIDCYFQNQVIPWERVPLDFREGMYKFFTDHPELKNPLFFANDLAIVRLKRRIAGVTPFQFDSTGAPISNGALMILISASHHDLRKRFDLSEPIVQSCHALKIARATSLYATSIYSDCSSDHGASGSVSLVRINGRLVIKGILRGSPDKAIDYTPFDMEKGSWTMHIGIDSDLLLEIKAIENGSLKPGAKSVATP